MRFTQANQHVRRLGQAFIDRERETEIILAITKAIDEMFWDNPPRPFTQAIKDSCERLNSLPKSERLRYAAIQMSGGETDMTEGLSDASWSIDPLDPMHIILSIRPEQTITRIIAKGVVT